uniref:Uncharacterized protein n=1 Tax=Glossina brevipalpis TaxID=37001 RepID=A0A1A9W374_9MUSC
MVNISYNYNTVQAVVVIVVGCYLSVYWQVYVTAFSRYNLSGIVRREDKKDRAQDLEQIALGVIYKHKNTITAIMAQMLVDNNQDVDCFVYEILSFKIHMQVAFMCLTQIRKESNTLSFFRIVRQCRKRFLSASYNY